MHIVDQRLWQLEKKGVLGVIDYREKFEKMLSDLLPRHNRAPIESFVREVFGLPSTEHPGGDNDR